MHNIHNILKAYWRYESFRPLQEEIIHSVLDGKDTLALLPTGGGKSLCYQLPAMAQEGLCLVISPLIALMKDQIENLRSKGIMALGIYSGMSKRLIAQTLKNASSGQYKFLYVSPERLETSLFLEFLPGLDVQLIAVDEAHCISQWGYDFRPSYLRIAALREELPDVPVLALTASATPQVQKDICEKLLFETENIFQQSFSRPNLSYSVLQADAKLNKLADVISKVLGTAIVYCRSRKRTTEIARLLQMHGLSADFYHAGLSADERSKKQEDWIQNKTGVIVCTNAFGMGIDKPDVRLVLHADIPESLESYYQEAGRAGRDGKKAYAVLLYNDKDIIELEELHAKRFPSLDEIKNVYNALVNYLQVPIYTGQDTSFTFKFEDFVNAFKLDSITALYALKALESDGWLHFNERNFTPSTVGFTVNKRGLYEFHESHPGLEPLLTTLLRTYEGIFDFPVFVSELLLAKLLKQKEEDIKRDLKKCAAFGMIDYAPQIDEPQIIFRKNRVAANGLLFNTAEYNKRKEAFIARVQTMISYVKTTTCRSNFINTYFGDKENTPCGICDNCLKTKNEKLSAEEFNSISNRIKESLNQSALTIEALLQQLNGINKEKAWKVINYLQAENKISLAPDGKLNIV